LRGYQDPEGEFGGRETVCSIIEIEGGCRLVIEHGGVVEREAVHPSIVGAMSMARRIRTCLIALGWSPIRKGRSRRTH
jgi:hypothetical protein